MTRPYRSRAGRVCVLCGDAIYARDWCRTHYNALYREQRIATHPKTPDSPSAWEGPSVGRAAVYALLDPHDKSVRYIGSTAHLERRIQGHLHTLTGNGTAVRWLRSLEDARERVLVRVLEWCAPERRHELERFWVSVYTKRGAPLVNDMLHPERHIDHDAIVAAYDFTRSCMRRLAAQYGVSRQRIQQILKQAGIAAPKRTRQTIVASCGHAASSRHTARCAECVEAELEAWRAGVCDRCQQPIARLRNQTRYFGGMCASCRHYLKLRGWGPGDPWLPVRSSRGPRDAAWYDASVAAIRARTQGSETHCLHGHLRAEHWGRWGCRACQRTRERTYRAKRRMQQEGLSYAL